MNMEITEKQNSPESKKLNVDYSNVNLSVNAQFIINYRNILDASINRGTWKGNELSQIGAIYQNVNSIIKSIEEQLRERVAISTEETTVAETEAAGEITSEAAAETENKENQ